MIVCSNCKHTNMAGTLFCSECGAALGVGDSITTQNIKSEQINEVQHNGKKGKHPTTPLTAALNNWVTLHLLDTGQVMPLSERNEFTLGRISEGQPVMPDIDLAPYRAYANGVSRLHAVIKRDASHVMLMDLGSANGTFVNGKRLKPNVEQNLNNGDVVALGKLKIQILLRASQLT